MWKLFANGFGPCFMVSRKHRRLRFFRLSAVSASVCLALCLALAVSSAAQQVETATGSTASISGTVFDQARAVATGAQVKLTRGAAPAQQVTSGDNGQFSFSNLAPGPFQLTVTAPGFDPKIVSGNLSAGQAYIVPDVVLNVARATTNVQVGLNTAEEVAEVQIKQQEKQRVLGIAPNFYVSYVPDAAPMNSRQ